MKINAKHIMKEEFWSLHYIVQIKRLAFWKHMSQPIPSFKVNCNWRKYRFG